MGNSDARRLPVVSLGSEHLAIGYLMRRNILAYKAPPNNEGYDLICIGGGIAGLVAGVRAAERGLKVAVLEKGTDPRYPCNARWSGGIIHIVSTLVIPQFATASGVVRLAQQLPLP